MMELLVAIGDYIKDKDCALWQGEIIKEGTVAPSVWGGGTPVYVARRPDGEIFYIPKEDAVKLGGDWPEDMP